MKPPHETLEQRIQRVLKEDVAIAPYNSRWPELFAQEKAHLLACLPRELVCRVEHFGSTAVPGLAAKPIVDILVEVTSLDETKTCIVPILEAQGYDYFWRPTIGDRLPYYAWFIKRDSAGSRSHHIHMVEGHFEHWERLLFRDFLIARPELAAEYHTLKLKLSSEFRNDREGYTLGKTDFVSKVTAQAKAFYAAYRSTEAKT